MSILRRFLNFIRGRKAKTEESQEDTIEAMRAARAAARRHQAELRRQSRNQ